MYKLTVACGTGSTVITEPSVATSEQLVDISLATTYFIMPQFTQSNNGCPALSYQAVDPADSATVLTNLVVTVSGTDLHVTPTDKSLHQEYSFKIKAVMTGLAGNEELVSTGIYNLKVGCGSWTTFQTDNIVTS